LHYYKLYIIKIFLLLLLRFTLNIINVISEYKCLLVLYTNIIINLFYSAFYLYERIVRILLLKKVTRLNLLLLYLIKRIIKGS
jgi:hypothetical protein